MKKVITKESVDSCVSKYSYVCIEDKGRAISILRKVRSNSGEKWAWVYLNNTFADGSHIVIERPFDETFIETLKVQVSKFGCDVYKFESNEEMIKEMGNLNKY